MTRTIRWPYLIGFLCCVSLLGYAYYEQYVKYLDPCPLCIVQRVFFAAMALVLLVGALHNAKGLPAKLYGLLVAVLAAGGAGIAGRHLWLQSLPPDQVPECGPGLEYMLETMAKTDVLSKILTGSGECATLDWSFLGISMPGWTLIWFVGLGTAALFFGFRARH